MVKQFRERNFILSRYGSEVYGFVHRAFLEYLAAGDIVRRHAQQEMTNEELLEDVFAQHAPDPAWHEVLLLIAGQTGERVIGRAVDRILDLEHPEDSRTAPPAVLALRILAEVRRIGLLQDQSARTAEALTRYWDRKQHYESEETQLDIESALASFDSQWAGRKQILRWLHASDAGDGNAVAACCLYTDMATLEIIAVSANHWAVRSGALVQLARKWPHKHAVRRFVQDRATQDMSDDVRGRAVKTLGEHWSEEPEIRTLIQHQATHDTDELVRGCALETLAQHWSEEPEIRTLIQHQATQDTNESVRTRALETLAQHWSEEPEIRTLIQHQATHDTNESVRTSALTALTQHWPDKPTKDDLVIELRARALAHAAATSPDFVIAALVHSPHPKVRKSAAHLLGGLWPADPRTIPLLRERAKKETDEETRDSITHAVAMAEAYAPIHDRLF